MEEKCRLDKWLWAARFYKTRLLATEAIHGGMVHIGDVRSKPSHTVKIGETMTIRKGPYLFTVTVKGLSKQRRPAKEAVLLYEEAAASIETREKTKLNLSTQGHPIAGGRPTKKDRRAFTKICEE